MITFSNIGYHGRLGNQLHQYALLKAVSLKTNYDIVLPPDVYDRVWHGQKCLLDSFELPSCRLGDIKYTNTHYDAGYRVYDESVFEIIDNTNFNGHFEHQKYASDIRNELLEEFRLKEGREDRALNDLSKYSGPKCSLHVRRGDLVGSPPEDSGWAESFNNGTVYNSYYSAAMKMVPDNATFFVFSGGARAGGEELKQLNKRDINWCKDQIKDDRVVFMEDYDDIETFSFIKNCDYNIVSFGSTFSWWASFLNKHNNVIAPKIFFPTKKFEDISPDRVWPDYWRLVDIQCSEFEGKIFP